MRLTDLETELAVTVGSIPGPAAQSAKDEDPLDLGGSMNMDNPIPAPRARVVTNNKQADRANPKAHPGRK